MSLSMKIAAEFFILSALLNGSVYKDNSIGVIGITKYGSIIRDVHPDSPASKAGLKNGDKLKEVVDEDGKHEITGEPYSEVTITVERKECKCGDNKCSCSQCDCSKIKVLKTFVITRLPWQLVKDKRTQNYYGK